MDLVRIVGSLKESGRVRVKAAIKRRVVRLNEKIEARAHAWFWKGLFWGAFTGFALADAIWQIIGR